MTLKAHPLHFNLAEEYVNVVMAAPCQLLTTVVDVHQQSPTEDDTAVPMCQSPPNLKSTPVCMLIIHVYYVHYMFPY
ncbi:hypothetical protein SNE40_021126 [Patella caerulea]|uniref:Uncharacterized protein n=1 Tax=Patella caerulea TaxID=87958 RepID=A0AAN8J0F9_PATCE